MKRLIVIVVLSLMMHTAVYGAQVLPYPSYMPGNKLYKVSRIIDELKKYWFWGAIGQMKYHQSLSDKYLVEAKTLFEYKQYPLALDALRRSDKHFQKISATEIYDAHIFVLTQLTYELPQSFIWHDEHQPPITLDLHGAINNSIAIRNE